ncbi:Diacetyl reductase [(S)-acetoin forming] [Grifola frondosa]|uniref:Diacetyl reductase [(S)-acetoin forming] n=1 Tax=Grifola frondosa TaxID=5627 RepID=A0A1C7MMD9_GRIFR|nr:Diacetyl reductase [(S)-acetoin forming] [Grifola frondosa]
MTRITCWKTLSETNRSPIFGFLVLPSSKLAILEPCSSLRARGHRLLSCLLFSGVALLCLQITSFLRLFVVKTDRVVWRIGETATSEQLGLSTVALAHSSPRQKDIMKLGKLSRDPFLMAQSTVRIAFVTGAARGIGEAIALRLADDGLDVAVNDIASKGEELAAVVKAIEAKGRRAIAVPGDVSSEEETIAMIDKVVKVLGGLDVMVANAGIFRIELSLLDTSVEEWETTMATNVRGTMLSFKHAARQMVKQGRGGRIIGACSYAGKKPMLSAASYNTSKFAVRGLTQSAAMEFAKYDITVNSYAPGAILTPMILSTDDAINGGPANTFLKYCGIPTDVPKADPPVVAGLVSYLVKPEAYFVTGQCININGGILFD